MASYTTSLRLVLPATGEYPGTWGTQANNGLTNLVDTSIAGTATITMTAADYTLSTANGATDEARAAILNLTGTPGAARNVIVPALSKLYVVFNNTTGGFAQTVKTSAGTGISVPNGASAYLRCNGTDVVEAVNYFGSLTVGTVTGGTFVSPSLTGTPTAPTAAGGTSTTQIATTAYVATNFAGLSSPAFTGTPTVPTAAPGTNTTQAASTAFVATSFAPLASPAFTGTPTAPTATAGTSTTQVATTAFVAATAFSSVLPGQTGNAGKYVTTDGTNASWESINLATSITGTLPVGNGGTGSSTLALNNVLLGNGTASLQTVAPGTSGNILLSDGTTWSSSAFPVITDPAKVPTTLTANTAAPYLPAVLYQWSITNLDSYTTYTITTSNGTVSRSGATINYTAAIPGSGGFTINSRNIGLTISPVNTFVSESTGSSSYPIFHQIAANSSFAVASYAGQMNSLGAANGNVFIDYRDVYGNSTWRRYIYDPGGVVFFYGNGIGLGSDNSLFTVVQEQTNTRGYFIKFSSAGATSWSKYLATFVPRGAVVDGSDNVISVGSASGLLRLVKYNTSGTLQWQVGDAAFSFSDGGLTSDSTLNIYVVGNTDLLKTNSAGVLQFASRVNTIAFTGVAVDSLGNIFACGNATNGYVFKFNSSGVLQWQRVVTGVNFQGIAVDSSGDVYASGNDTAVSSLNVVAKWNTSGAVQWQRTVTFTGASNQGDCRIAVVGSSYYISNDQALGPNFLKNLMKFPTDGTGTGSATPSGGVTRTYAVSSYTEGAGALTTAASTISLAATAMAETTATPSITTPSTTNYLFQA